jgi:hypothetical protein
MSSLNNYGQGMCSSSGGSTGSDDLCGTYSRRSRASEERGVAFISLTENIDTGTPGGRLVFHLFGALAEFERDLIRE